MAPAALLLLLLLLNVSACSGFGFRSCAQNYNDPGRMWCLNRGIVNISEVVRMFPENTTLINLSKNEIRAVPPGSFAHFAGLKHLDLNQNKLLFLRGEEFRGLHLMQFLNLSCNQISHIHSDTFKGLVSLNVLLLSQNNLSSVSGLLFNLLPAIQAVDLSFNALKSFSCEECGGSSTLEHLNVSVNHIREVNVSCFPALKYVKLSNNSELELQPDAFESNQQLRTLLLVSVKLEALMGLSPQTKRNLSHVSFSMLAEKSPWTICDVLRGMDHISKVQVDLKGSKLPQSNVSLLDCPTPNTLIFMEAKLGNVARLSSGRRSTGKLCLTNCGLKQISNSTFEGFAALKTLCLDKNAVVIEPDAFRGMTKLRSLNLDRNRIRDIDPRWFLPLKNLTQLSLMKNEITELEPSVFHALTQLEQLYLQFNLLKSLKNRTFSNLFKLQRLSLSLNIICFIQPGTFQDLKNLRFLDLSGNRLRRVTPYILSGLDTLVHLILYNNRLQFRSYESPFFQLTSLEYLEMRYQGPGGGIGDIGPDFFKGLQKLRCINIGNSIKMNIHADAFAPLTSLKILYIDGVVLKDINLTAVLFPLKSLSKLMLNMADLDTLPANLLPPNNSLRILQVSSNHIHTLNKELLDNLPGLVYFDISQNPLSCTCDNSWFKTWATNNAKTQVVYLYNLRCDNNRSSRHLWQFDDKACSYDQISLMLFITCSTTDVLLVFACLVWHTQGPALRLLLLMAKAKLRGRKKGAGAKFQYDAFISYNSRDEDWVMGQLVPNLERPAPGAQRLKLCLHHRDFRPGAAVLENIEAAIYGSRHTICVVTRSYLQSDWCSVEFQLASLRLLCDGSDVLLLVFLEEIPERCLSPYTRLRRIVHKKTYLLWPENPLEQEAFWVRLMDALRDREESKEAGEIGGEQRLAP